MKALAARYLHYGACSLNRVPLGYSAERAPLVRIPKMVFIFRYNQSGIRSNQEWLNMRFKKVTSSPLLGFLTIEQLKRNIDVKFLCLLLVYSFIAFILFYISKILNLVSIHFRKLLFWMILAKIECYQKCDIANFYSVQFSIFRTSFVLLKKWKFKSLPIFCCFLPKWRNRRSLKCILKKYWRFFP